jgi:hypothetical protein
VPFPAGGLFAGIAVDVECFALLGAYDADLVVGDTSVSARVGDGVNV